MAAESRHILITGAGKRIGRELALHYSTPGTSLALHYNTSEAGTRDTQQLVRDKGGEAECFQADLSDCSGFASFGQAIVEHAGQLDVVILSAATFAPCDFKDMSEDDWDTQMNINLKGNVFLVKELLPHLAPNASIVMIADWSGLRPYTGYLPYCVSKAALIAASKALAQELAPDVRVNCVCPGTMLPPDNAPDAKVQGIADATPLKRIGNPADVIAAVDFFVNGSDFATGSHLVVDGGRLISNSELY